MTHTEEIMAVVFILDGKMELARAPLVEEAGWGELSCSVVLSTTLRKGKGRKPLTLLSCSLGLRAVLPGQGTPLTLLRM